MAGVSQVSSRTKKSTPNNDKALACLLYLALDHCKLLQMPLPDNYCLLTHVDG